MRRFDHVNAQSLAEAVQILEQHGSSARIIAGGTDLLGGLRDEIWMNYPTLIVNLKTVTGLNSIELTSEEVRIGALSTLTDVAASQLIQEHFPALAKAAWRTASPLLRNLGTIAGNICQENRCWYYRFPHRLGGRIECARKGGQKCLALAGDHRYHSIFGPVNKCVAVNSSDIAPALMVLGAKIQTTKRVIDITQFFSAQNGAKSTVLADNEIVTEIRLPMPSPGTNSAFTKTALRKTIDFALVNCAASVSLDQDRVSDVRVCLNGVFGNPYLAEHVAEVLLGCELSLETARLAGEAALSGARPLRQTGYKVQIAKALVVDTLMACLQRQQPSP